jgi:hypothetical protein
MLSRWVFRAQHSVSSVNPFCGAILTLSPNVASTPFGVTGRDGRDPTEEDTGERMAGGVRGDSHILRSSRNRRESEDETGEESPQSASEFWPMSVRPITDRRSACKYDIGLCRGIPPKSNGPCCLRIQCRPSRNHRKLQSLAVFQVTSCDVSNQRAAFQPGCR